MPALAPISEASASPSHLMHGERESEGEEFAQLSHSRMGDQIVGKEAQAAAAAVDLLVVQKYKWCKLCEEVLMRSGHVGYMAIQDGSRKPSANDVHYFGFFLNLVQNSKVTKEF